MRASLAISLTLRPRRWTGRITTAMRIGTHMSLDAVITGGTVIDEQQSIKLSVGLKDGKVAGIYTPGTEPAAARVIDASGLAVIPGLVDVHSHHREPGFEYKEDIDTVTRAAAAGGVTTTLGMPNISPPPTTAKILDDILQRYVGRAFVDYHINPSPTVPGELEAMAATGISAFKVFMVTDTGRDYPHMPGIGVHDSGQLFSIMQQCAAIGVPLMVHPHEQALMDHIEHELWDRGERDARAYAKAYAAYDGIAWDTAIALLLRMQEATGVHLHLLHVQTERTVEMIAQAKARGQRVTAEINPWALFLGVDWENIERMGSYALSYWIPEKHHPALWDGLNEGIIDIVSTDHAPHTREDKEPGWTDGWKAHTGTPSTQFYLSLLLNAAAEGKISINRVIQATSTTPARAFRLDTKGSLTPGSDADIVLVDLNREVVINNSEVLSKCGWTPYDGRTVKGVPVQTILHGQTVYERERGIIGEPSGRLAVSARGTQR
ncbi:dihydroorotase family protein [Dactylosporangium sp. NPDC051484]|uniref:dihydroorotase n=1 Tax=Dactylosporangium sp. NPDC051484 TaxID=3154942 RepID=UPI00344E883D